LSRTQRFLSGVGLGYVNTAVTAIAGIFLTRFFLGRLGTTEYGYWLMAAQVIAYAALLDLGIVGILPRETAFTMARAALPEDPSELRRLVAQTFRLVLWQMPMLAVAVGAGWLMIPVAWQPLRWPLAVVLTVFVLLFPFRIPQAVLTGLQDLAFVARVYLLGWTLGTATTVTLVVLGWHLYSFAVGFAVHQLASVVLCLFRLRTRYSGVLLFPIPPLSRGFVREYLSKAGWVSVSQIAQILLNGTDVLVVGYLFGPSAVVPYTCTAKLAVVLGNQPLLLNQVAAPALSEIRVAGTRAHVYELTRALSQALLTATGGVVALVAAINEGFVTWWVGPAQYGGMALTLVVLVQIFLRHWNVGFIYAIFSFGRERRIAVTAILDGIVTVAASLLLGRWLGLVGIPLGSIVGVLFVGLPSTVSALAAESGIPTWRVATANAWWAWRLAPIVALSTAAAYYLAPRGLVMVGLASLAILTIYLLAMLSPSLRPPLGQYTRPRLESALATIASVSLRRDSTRTRDR